jgi:hypothetical protein
MNARRAIRDIIIAKKMQRGSLIGRYRFIEPSFPRARARRHYWRFLRKYPEVGARLGLNEGSVY